jgi:cell wall-associated NlpC family hydrolase
MWTFTMRIAFVVALACMSACAAGCASTGGTPEPFPRPGRRSAPPVITAPVGTTGHRPADGYALAGTALALRGAPYRNGGADPSGFDCSGFIEYVFAQHGIAVPRTVEDLFAASADVAPDDLQPGDLVFFATTSRGPSHVGMAIGGDAFVHAPSTQGVVRVERVSAPYWAPRFVGARRIKQG